MSTELMTVEKSGFLALQEGSSLREAIDANVGEGEGFSESQLTRVKIPSGGATQWTVDELEGDKTYPAIEGVLVYYGKGGVIWPSQEPALGTIPVLRTDDCRTAYRVGEDLGDVKEELLKKFSLGDGLYDWKALTDAPNAPFGWGTGKGGAGKRSREYRVLCILRKAFAFPILIRATPGSLKNVSQFISKLTAAGHPYYSAIVSLTLEKAIATNKQQYAKIVPKCIGILDAGARAAVQELFTKPLAAVMKQIDVADAVEADDE